MNNPGKGTNVDVSNTTWTYGGYSVTYNASQSGNRYVFTYRASLNGVVYYTITGWENTDASAGHWDETLNTSVLVPGSDNYNINFDWNRVGNNGYHYEMSYDMGASQLMHYVANINDDMSGNFSYALNGNPFYSCIWNAAGHGTFTDYSSNPPSITPF